MKAFAALSMLLLVGAGCLSASTPASDTGAAVPVKRGARGLPTALENEPLPPTCSATQIGIVHGFEANISAEPLLVGVGCLTTTQWGGGEPTVGLTSKGNLFLYPAWDNPSMVPPAPGQFVGGLGLARSTDEGATWTRHLSMVGPVNWHAYTADPFMYVDPATDRIFMEDLMVPPFNCSNLSFSDDEGLTWTQTLGGCLVWDHVSYGSGKPVTSRPTGYPNVVYRCAITYVMTTLASFASGCQKTLDGGRTWQPPGEPAFLFGPDGPYAPSTCHGAHGHITVDLRGWVWLPRGWCGDPYVAVSKDEGATWTRHMIHDEPMAGHDGNIAVDANGVAYYFWINRDALPYLSVSRDDGKTWSEPRNVAPPGVTATGMPNLEAGGAGKIAISYLANLESASGVHAVMTVGYGVDTDEPVFQSVFANPPDKSVANGNCRGTCPGQADFLGLAIGPDGTPWMSVMNRGHLSATRLYGAPSLWDESDSNGPYK